MPQRRACRMLAQARNTQRYLPKLPQDEKQLREAEVALAELQTRLADLAAA